MGAFRVAITPRPAVAAVQPVSKLEMWSAGRFTAIALELGRQLPNIFVALLTPAALVALAMGLWRVSEDLDWAGAFPITSGFFSHWQVWIALSVALKILSSGLLAWDGRTRKISEQN